MNDFMKEYQIPRYLSQLFRYHETYRITSKIEECIAHQKRNFEIICI